jgi:hypothetical protein
MMMATQNSASKILGRLRAASTPLYEVTEEDKLWYAAAEQLEGASKLIPSEKVANLTILANIGVQYAELQKSVSQQIETTSGVDVHAHLSKIEAALSSGGGRGPFLLGDGSTISTVDLALVCALRQLISLLYTIRSYPSIGNWFAACCTLDAVTLEIGSQRALGTKRIGHQIDLRPNSKDAYAAAMNSIFLNKGQKKKVTQRQKEKANKKSKKNNAGGAGAGESKASVSEPAAAQVNNTVTEFPATHEKAHENLLAAVRKTGTIQEETKLAATTDEEVASWAKSLFLKDKKKKKLFMFTTPANAPSVSLSVLTKALGMKQLRMAGPKDMKGALGCERGCVTAMSVVNDCECKVTSVLDSRLVNRNLRMCTGCEDPADHTQHHISEQEHASLLTFLKDCGHSPLIFDHETNTVA